MKTYLVVLAGMLVLGMPCAIAQTTIAFGYDKAGNRTSRTIALPKTAEADSAYMDENTREDLLGSSKLLIYPNPTKGYLQVEVADSDTQIAGQLTLTDLNGRVLYTSQLSEGINTIDMSAMAPATYILRMEKNGQVSTWRIVRE